VRAFKIIIRRSHRRLLTAWSSNIMLSFARLERRWIEPTFRNPLHGFVDLGFHKVFSGGRNPVPVPPLQLGPVQA